MPPRTPKNVFTAKNTVWVENSTFRESPSPGGAASDAHVRLQPVSPAPHATGAVSLSVNDPRSGQQLWGGSPSQLFSSANLRGRPLCKPADSEPRTPLAVS